MGSNDFFDAGSDQSVSEDGYDSEAAEISKTTRPNKRRRLNGEDSNSVASESDFGYDSEVADVSTTERTSKRRKDRHNESDDEDIQEKSDLDEILSRRTGDIVSIPKQPVSTEPQSNSEEEHSAQSSTNPNTKQKPTPSQPAREPARVAKKREKKKSTPGVVYLSSLPPYLKPSALRNLLAQRGFSPISRLFLSPASSSKSSSKNSRQLYTEGWLEFPSRSVAKLCAETLNATIVGGRKGGYYHDDLWNMKYLRGMRWEELMAGVREEKREVEGRRDEERRRIGRESKVFVEGVEEGRRVEGMRRKREEQARRKESGDAEVRPKKDISEAEVRRTWRQTEVKGGKKAGGEKISDEVRSVLGKIF